MEAEAQRLGAKAEREGDLRAALMALRELGRAFELQGKIIGAFQHETAGNQIVLNVVSYRSDGDERMTLSAREGESIIPA